MVGLKDEDFLVNEESVGLAGDDREIREGGGTLSLARRGRTIWENGSTVCCGQGKDRKVNTSS